MRQTHLVGVDYEELADYLQHTYAESVLLDIPAAASASVSFKHFRGILRDHAEEMMDEQCGDNDPLLTHILLRDHIWGTVKDVRISTHPGYVARVQGQAVILPFILIEVID